MDLNPLLHDTKIFHSIAQSPQTSLRLHQLGDGKKEEWKKRVLVSRAAWCCEKILGFGLQ